MFVIIVCGCEPLLAASRHRKVISAELHHTLLSNLMTPALELIAKAVLTESDVQFLDGHRHGRINISTDRPRYPKRLSRERRRCQYVHAEVIKPALALLSDPAFATANDEFMTAHKHYRDGHYKDCIVAAQRAFESTLKAICTARNWSYAPGDRATELVTAVRKQGLFPDFLGKAMDTYIAMLKTGLPGVRNNAGGHGDEPNAPVVPGYLAAYALHLTAANIVLVVEAFCALR
jgi:HEPN domain